MEVCINALKALFRDLDARVIDLETNLCSKIEYCIRNNAGVIDAITDLINSLLPAQQTPFTCADVASCINNNQSVKTALDNRLSSNSLLFNAWLNGSNFLPGSGVRDKIANAKFSGLSDGDYVIKKVGGVYNLVPSTSTPTTCVPIAGSSNQSTGNITTQTASFYDPTNGITYQQDVIRVTLLQSGTYNITCNPNVYNSSGGNVNFNLWKRISPTSTTTTGVISPVTLGGSATGFYNPSNGNPSGTISGNAGDVFEFSFPNNTNSSYYIYPGTYPVTLSYDCSTTGVFN